VSTGKINLIAYLTVKEGSEAVFAEKVDALIKAVRAEEAGCLRYEMYKQKENPLEYMVVEQYVNQSALDLHNAGLVDKFGDPAPGEGLPAGLAILLSGAELVFYDEV
jgi:quinol monooxygenase YgiN